MSDTIDRQKFENERQQNNMRIWNNVCKTNPSHTKKVKIGREFTAIDPYRQVEAATRELGPAGDSWGWHIREHLVIEETKQLAVLVILWHSRDTSKTIEQWGQTGLYIDRNHTKPDTDCFKKATTDAITKCLSYLGFNADVFTGQFDDNKYVAQVQAEFNEQDAKKKREADKQYEEEAKKVVATINTCESEGDLKQAYADNAGDIEGMSDQAKAIVRAAYKTKLVTFKQE